MNNYRKRAAAFAWVLALAPALSAGAETLEVRLASQEAIAPKWIKAQAGMAGICPDILAAVERAEPRLHFSGYRQSRSLPGIEAGLEDGSLDAACALIPTPRRHRIALAVSKPVYLIRHLLAVRSTDPAAVRDVQDLARLGALVTSQRGSAFTEQLKAAGVKVDDATDDNAVNVRKMLAGHGRFAYVNEMVLRHYLRAEHLETQVRVLPPVLGIEPSYFWVSRKADPRLAPLLAAALDKLRANGELERIYARWAASQ